MTRSPPRRDARFTEVRRPSTWPVELLNNLAPKNRIYGLVEIDVTKARNMMTENENRTGVKLSFTAWVTKCFAQAISEHPEIQAFKKGKSKLVIFDDVDVSVMIDRVAGTRRVTFPYTIKKANEKDIKQIHEEIRRVQTCESLGPSGGKLTAAPRFLLKAPGFLRKPFWWKVRSDPVLRKEFMGTACVTSVGMFGKEGSGGFAIPVGLHPVVLALGGIAKKPIYPGDPARLGEWLSVTAMFDEEVSLGAPATRFLARLSELMQSGFGLGGQGGLEWPQVEQVGNTRMELVNK